jgi:NAD(P)-dependent dehydrogenase (short-subunit alcohol dehydrogenase family)
MATAAAAKRILVTGGNAGIGLALCRQLAVDHGCFVYMCSRSPERGAVGMKKILDAHPEAAGSLELLTLDVADPVSVAAAAASLKSKGVKLYALVNNAGIGFQTDAGDVQALFDTNFYGPKRVSEALVDLIDSSEGRIVNVSSGAASMWLRNQSNEQKRLFASADTTWEQLETAVMAALPGAPMGGYGLSKAALCTYTMIQAKMYPNLKCTSLSPGFIATAMTQGFGARLTAEQGTVSYMRCIFGDVVSGYYYGSDGLRSPLTVTRDPGTPEYQGEDNPNATKYNK